MFENTQQLLYIDQAWFVQKIQGLFQDYFRTFFIFQGLNFFPILYKGLFQPEALNEKSHLISLILTPVINRDYHTNWIEKNTSRTSLFDVHLAISTQFYAIFTQFLAHPINLKGLVVFYIFQRLIHIFKDDCTKFQDDSRTKGTFFKFHEFSRTKV